MEQEVIHFSWTNSLEVTQNIDNLAPGFYQVTVTDINGCTAQNGATITEPNELILISSTVSDFTGFGVSCFGEDDGEIIVQITGGASPLYSTSWFPTVGNENVISGGNNPPYQNLKYSGLTDNNYNFTVTDINGCTAQDNATITEPDELTATMTVGSDFTGFGVSCFGENDGEINVTTTGGAGGNTFSWTNTSQVTQDINNLSANTYVVTITDNNSCTAQGSATITEPDELTASANSVDLNGFGISCFGANDGEINVTTTGGAGGNTFSWTNTSQVSQNIDNLSANTYVVTITDNNGCTAQDNATITEPGELTANATVASNFTGFGVSCFGEDDGEVNVTTTGGAGGNTFSWTNTSQVSQNIDNLSANTYVVTITDNNGCTSQDNATITEPGELTATATVTSDFTGFGVSCFGANDGEVNVTTTGGAGGNTFSWTNTPQVSQNIDNLSANTYEVTITDNNGCTAQDNATINEPDELTATATVASNFNGFGVSCFGANDGEVNVTTTGGAGGNTFSWTNTPQVSQNIDNLSANTYVVTITDNNGCTAQDNATINEPDELTAGVLTINAASVQEICYNTIPSDLITSGVSGGQQPYSFVWQYNDGSGYQPINNTLSNYTSNALINSTNFRVIFLSALGCGQDTSNIASVTVLNEVNPGNIINSQILCFDSIGTALTFDPNALPTGGGGSYDYLWQKKSSNAWINQGNSTDTYNLSVLNPGFHYYRLQVTSNLYGNCIDRYTDSVTIFVYPQLTAQITTNDQNICYNTFPENALQVSPQGAGNIYTFQWYEKLVNDVNYSLINGAQSNSYMPITPLTDSTIFSVEVTSTFGCGTILANNEVSINVADTFSGNLNSLTPILDTICYNTTVLIQTINEPEGGYSPYSYEWEFKDNLTNGWQSVNTTNTDYYEFENLITNSHFRVTYNSNVNSAGESCGSYTSDSILIVVLEQVDPGIILESDTICNGDNAQTISFGVSPTGGNNIFDYQWQEWNQGWEDIIDSTNLTFSPGSLTFLNLTE